MSTTGEEQYRVVSPDKTVQALRDSGYSSSIHALAELIDNAIEAGATTIDVLLLESSSKEKRRRNRITEIAVLDNGEGMAGETLRRGLKFGDGTRLKSRKGIGRFGVGLPNSSISQAKRVDVWTWQNGPTNALHSYLDLDEIAQGDMVVPAATRKVIPGKYSNLASITSTSGTLVLWSNLDRVEFKTAKTIMKHAEPLIGRIYRHFITNKRVVVRLVPVLDEAPVGDSLPIRVNDPLFLMSGTCTPPPFDKVPMFDGFGNPHEIPVTYTRPDGTLAESVVRITCSHAKKAARVENKSELPWPKQYVNPGESPWGKAAAECLGVSLVRADREMLMDTSWANNYEPTERWWSVEVAYSPELDEVFGTVTNKQYATLFLKGSAWDWRNEAEEGETKEDYVARLQAEGDLRVPLFTVWDHIKRQISLMREENKARRPRRTHGRHPDTNEPILPEAQDIASAVVEREQEEGLRPGQAATLGATATPEERRNTIVENLTAVHKLDYDKAMEEFANIELSGRKVNFVTDRLPGVDFFFNVESLPDLIQVALNEDHAAYKYLVAPLEELPEGASTEELLARLAKASLALRLLLFAWAHMEDQKAVDGRRHQDYLRDVRNDWGRKARNCFDAYGGGDGD